MMDPYIAGAASLSILAYAVVNISANVQKRKIKEAECRVKVAELELEKLRHSPKYSSNQVQEYGHGLEQRM